MKSTFSTPLIRGDSRKHSISDIVGDESPSKGGHGPSNGPTRNYSLPPTTFQTPPLSVWKSLAGLQGDSVRKCVGGLRQVRSEGVGEGGSKIGAKRKRQLRVGGVDGGASVEGW